MINLLLSISFIRGLYIYDYNFDILYKKHLLNIDHFLQEGIGFYMSALFFLVAIFFLRRLDLFLDSLGLYDNSRKFLEKIYFLPKTKEPEIEQYIPPKPIPEPIIPEEKEWTIYDIPKTKKEKERFYIYYYRTLYENNYKIILDIDPNEDMGVKPCAIVGVSYSRMYIVLTETNEEKIKQIKTKIKDFMVYLDEGFKYTKSYTIIYPNGNPPKIEEINVAMSCNETDDKIVDAFRKDFKNIVFS